MKNDIEARWINEAKALLALGMSAYNELPPFATSMLTYFYGPSSPQMHSFQQLNADVFKDKSQGPKMALFMNAKGAIQATIRELEKGLVGNLRTAVEGELLGDVLGLAREALSQNTEATKNVAAVLVAAAFEDCLRRLAAEKAGIQDRPKLEGIIGALKDGGLLKGGNLSLANTMLKFRNDSLHADWQQVQRAQVESCLALTESLLREHFS